MFDALSLRLFVLDAAADDAGSFFSADVLFSVLFSLRFCISVLEAAADDPRSAKGRLCCSYHY